VNVIVVVLVNVIVPVNVGVLASNGTRAIIVAT
jgi:hypothetical protein